MKVSYCIHFSIKLGSISVCTTPCSSDRLEYLLMMCTYMLTGKLFFIYDNLARFYNSHRKTKLQNLLAFLALL